MKMKSFLIGAVCGIAVASLIAMQSRALRIEITHKLDLPAKRIALPGGVK
jgi:predicted small secreted protein